MKENYNEKLLKLWKVRQIEEGYDVSNVHTLEEAEHFFDKKMIKKSAKIENKFENMSWKELVAHAKSLGLKTVRVKKANLIASIEELENKPVEHVIIQSEKKEELVEVTENKETNQEDNSIPDGLVEPIGE